MSPILDRSTGTLHPLRVITVLKTGKYLKMITGILNFVINIKDYRTTNRIMQCFRCQAFDHKAGFCNTGDCCVKCAGNHPSRTCTKVVALPAKCANCLGEHSANYQGCPETKKCQERRDYKTPSASKQRKPNVSSVKEFPMLSRRQRVELTPPTPPPSDDIEISK